MSSTERPKQLGKLTIAAEIALAGAAVFATGGALYRASEFRNNNDLFQRHVENTTKQLYLTDKSGDIDQIPLRAEPLLSEDSIVAYTKPGNPFFADQEYGVVYPSGQQELGKVKVDGDFAGIWFKGIGLPLFKKGPGDHLVPILDEDGLQKKSGKVYVSGNFLKATQTQDK